MCKALGDLGRQSHPFFLGKRRQLPARFWRLRRESDEGMRGRAFLGEGTAQTKAQRLERAWHE